MNDIATKHRQRGATLIVGLIMLVLITLMVLTAFTQSSTNLKSVGNMQYRDEAAAATNAAIEEVISSPAIFITPAATAVVVGPYSVSVATPECLYAIPVEIYSSGDQNPGIFIEGAAASGASGFLDTYWDIAATVNDAASGTRVESHQGIKITLSADPNPCP